MTDRSTTASASASAAARRRSAQGVPSQSDLGPITLRGWDLRPIPANDNNTHILEAWMERAARLFQQHWPVITAAAATAAALAVWAR